jgi:hypothetical protein
MRGKGFAPFSAPIHPPCENGWLSNRRSDGVHGVVGSHDSWRHIAFFKTHESTAAGPHGRHHNASHDQSTSQCLRELSWERCPIFMLLFSVSRLNSSILGSSRVVLPLGESPRRVIAPPSGCFPQEIRSCPVYWAAPGGSCTRALALESRLGMPWVASGLPSPPPLFPLPCTRQDFPP